LNGTAADTLTSSRRWLSCCTPAIVTASSGTLSADAVSLRTSTATMPSLLPLIPVVARDTAPRLAPERTTPKDSMMTYSGVARPSTDSPHSAAPSPSVVRPSGQMSQ
jgi:hypothetical protein